MAKLRREIARDEDRRATPSARSAAATRCRRWRSPATPTPASPRCSTGSPAPACWSRTRCSPPSTRPCAGPRRPTAATYTLADTVGFVRHLPHQLVEAFRSTLEEVAEADLILHVVDGSDADPEAQLAAVREVLADVDAHERARARRHQQGRPGRPAGARPAAPAARSTASSVSARTGQGLRRAAAADRPRAAPPVGRRATSCCPTTGATWCPGCTTTASCSSRSTGPTAPGSARWSPRRWPPSSRRTPGALRRPGELGDEPGKDSPTPGFTRAPRLTKRSACRARRGGAWLCPPLSSPCWACSRPRWSWPSRCRCSDGGSGPTAWPRRASRSPPRSVSGRCCAGRSGSPAGPGCRGC